MADQPPIDPSAWESLVAQLGGSTTIARRFTTDVAAALPGRLDRLGAALQAADAEDAYVTLLSMRTGAEMVGAGALACRLTTLEALARAGRLAECTEQVTVLRTVADAALDALAAADRARTHPAKR